MSKPKRIFNAQGGTLEGAVFRSVQKNVERAERLGRVTPGGTYKIKHQDYDAVVRDGGSVLNVAVTPKYVRAKPDTHKAPSIRYGFYDGQRVQGSFSSASEAADALAKYAVYTALVSNPKRVAAMNDEIRQRLPIGAPVTGLTEESAFYDELRLQLSSDPQQLFYDTAVAASATVGLLPEYFYAVMTQLTVDIPELAVYIDPPLNPTAVSSSDETLVDVRPVPVVENKHGLWVAGDYRRREHLLHTNSASVWCYITNDATPRLLLAGVEVVVPDLSSEGVVYEYATADWFVGLYDGAFVSLIPVHNDAVFRSFAAVDVFWPDALSNIGLLRNPSYLLGKKLSVDSVRVSEQMPADAEATLALLDLLLTTSQQLITYSTRYQFYFVGISSVAIAESVGDDYVEAADAVVSPYIKSAVGPYLYGIGNRPVRPSHGEYVVDKSAFAAYVGSDQLRGAFVVRSRSRSDGLRLGIEFNGSPQRKGLVGDTTINWYSPSRVTYTFISYDTENVYDVGITDNGKFEVSGAANFYRDVHAGWAFLINSYYSEDGTPAPRASWATNFVDVTVNTDCPTLDYVRCSSFYDGVTVKLYPYGNIKHDYRSSASTTFAGFLVDPSMSSTDVSGYVYSVLQVTPNTAEYQAWADYVTQLHASIDADYPYSMPVSSFNALNAVCSAAIIDTYSNKTVVAPVEFSIEFDYSSSEVSIAYGGTAVSADVSITASRFEQSGVAIGNVDATVSTTHRVEYDYVPISLGRYDFTGLYTPIFRGALFAPVDQEYPFPEGVIFETVLYGKPFTYTAYFYEAGDPVSSIYYFPYFVVQGLPRARVSVVEDVVLQPPLRVYADELIQTADSTDLLVYSYGGVSEGVFADATPHSLAHAIYPARGIVAGFEGSGVIYTVHDTVAVPTPYYLRRAEFSGVSVVDGITTCSYQKTNAWNGTFLLSKNRLTPCAFHPSLLYANNQVSSNVTCAHVSATVTGRYPEIASVDEFAYYTSSNASATPNRFNHLQDVTAQSNSWPLTNAGRLLEWDDFFALFGCERSTLFLEGGYTRMSVYAPDFPKHSVSSIEFPVVPVEIPIPAGDFATAGVGLDAPPVVVSGMFNDTAYALARENGNNVVVSTAPVFAVSPDGSSYAPVYDASIIARVHFEWVVQSLVSGQDTAAALFCSDNVYYVPRYPVTVDWLYLDTSPPFKAYFSTFGLNHSERSDIVSYTTAPQSALYTRFVDASGLTPFYTLTVGVFLLNTCPHVTSIVRRWQ